MFAAVKALGENAINFCLSLQEISAEIISLYLKSKPGAIEGVHRKPLLWQLHLWGVHEEGSMLMAGGVTGWLWSENKQGIVTSWLLSCRKGKWIFLRRCQFWNQSHHSAGENGFCVSSTAHHECRNQLVKLCVLT